MVRLIKLKPVHYFGFLYIAFAHLTDKKYKRVEQLTIWQCVAKWSQTEITHGDYTTIMDEVMEWYKDKMHECDFEEEIFEIAEYINDFKWFTKKQKIESLSDLKQIAISDKKFLKKEQAWIEKIGQIWGISKQEIYKII